MSKIFTPQDFLKVPSQLSFVGAEVSKNLFFLAQRCSKLEAAFGSSLPPITSGVRTLQEHLEIYRKKGITDPAKIPMNSWHLRGGAVDFADPHGLLDLWLFHHENELKKIELWVEHPDATPGWAHVQISAPRSGKRYFYP